MFGIGWGEITIILLLILILFGPKKSGEILKALGQGIREFKQALSDVEITEVRKADFQHVTDYSKRENQIQDADIQNNNEQATRK